MALSVPEKLKGKVFIRESPIAPAAAINEGHDPPNRRYRPSSPAAQSPTRGYGISMFRMPVMLIAFPIALPEIDQTINGDGDPMRGSPCLRASAGVEASWSSSLSGLSEVLQAAASSFSVRNFL
jgi:hypothetical protein